MRPTPRAHRQTLFDYPDDDGGRAFTRKWSWAGETAVSRDDVQVVLTQHARVEPPDTNARVLARTHGHEQGHAYAMQSLTEPEIAECVGPRRWANEVDAWARYRATRTPFDLLDSQHVLDALNTYRRGLDVPDDEWEEVRQLVSAWTRPEDQNALAEYEPLEPDPNDGAPDGETPDDWWFGPDPGDGEAKDGEADGGTPPPPSEADEDEARKARDAWLHTSEGVAVTRSGTVALAKALGEHGWPASGLPPLTRGLLMKA